MNFVTVRGGPFPFRFDGPRGGRREEKRTEATSISNANLELHTQRVIFIFRNRISWCFGLAMDGTPGGDEFPHPLRSLRRTIVSIIIALCK